MSLLRTTVRRLFERRTSNRAPASPILLIDYCRVPDKYELLRELGPALAPHRLYVIDGYRQGLAMLQAMQPHVHPLSPPAGVFYRASRLQALGLWHRRSSTRPRWREYGARYARLSAERYPRVDPEHATRCVATAHDFASETIERLRPALAIVWNAFHPLSQAACAAAERHRVRLAYFEYGVLPGTLNLDFEGQMGESVVARNPAQFDALPVTEEDLARADRTLQELRRSGVNRRDQPPATAQLARLRARAGDRPVILFAGHNDHAAGVDPYDDRARRCHSPIFASSASAAARLGELAERHGWFILYKPHPFAAKAQMATDTDSLAVIGSANINQCIDAADLVVTVLSQVSYLALIRDRAVVMLGYNQLRDKGCVYQAETDESIADQIRAALAHGLTAKQRSAWHHHVARLQSYYLYRYSAAVDGGAQPPARLADVIRRATAGDLRDELA